MAASPFDAVQIGPLKLRNRFIKSATNEGMAKGGVPSKALLEHHRSMAAGGAAMTTVAYCAVSADGRTFVDQVTLNRESLPHLRALTDAVHREGGLACAQITHGGAFNFLPELTTRYPYSASGGVNPAGILSGRLFKTAMDRAAMDQIGIEFVEAAKLAREAGFDAAEIHMGHGYLLSQFISPGYNKRRDEYGGGPAQRVRYPAEILRRVLDEIGGAMAVTCKICVTEGFRGGATVDDAIEVARVLEREGAHLLVLSGGMNVESPWAIFNSPLPTTATEAMQSTLMRVASKLSKLREPKIEFRDLYFLEHSRKLRAAVKMPLSYLGGAKTLAGIEQVVGEGFDCVAMGRALIHDPDLINKFRDGRATKSGCTACNQCVVMMYTAGGTACVLHGKNDVKLNQIPAAA